MATITRYVDPNAAAGGDGTTNGLSGATCAYASMAIWEAAQQQNLTDGGGDIAECICDSNGGAADTTAVTIDGWTTSSTSYIWIHTPTSSRHDGTYLSTKYRLEVNDATVLAISDDYVRIEGLQIEQHGQTAVRSVVYISGQTASSNDVRISSSIIKQGGGTSFRSIGVHIVSSNAVVSLWNSVIFNPANLGTSDTQNSAIRIASSSSVNIYSCTVFGGYRVLRADSGTVVVKNTYVGVIGGLTAYFGSATLTTCASSDATGSSGLQNIAINTSNFTNVTAGSENYHLPSGSALIDVGTDTSGDSAPLNFTDDIDGQTRSGSWDIGADEYVAGGGIEGQASLTQDAQSLSSTGTVSIAGSASITQAAQIVSAAGTIPISGEAALTQAEQTVSATGVIAIQGLANITQAAQTIIATGFITRLVDAPHTSIHIRPSAFTIVGGFGSGSGPGMGQSGFLQGVGIYQ